MDIPTFRADPACRGLRGRGLRGRGLRGLGRGHEPEPMNAFGLRDTDRTERCM